MDKCYFFSGNDPEYTPSGKCLCYYNSGKKTPADVGSLGLKPPTGGNLTTTPAGEQEKTLPGDREVRKKL
jgi:hypothetical protein